MSMLKKIWGGKKPSQLVESTMKHLQVLEQKVEEIKKATKNGQDTTKLMTERAAVVEKLKEDLKGLHFMLYGDPDTDPSADTIGKLIPLLLDGEENIIFKFSRLISELEFESKKQAADIMNYLIRRCNKNPKVGEYLKSHKQIIHFLLDGFEDHKLAQHVGSVLQEIAKRQELAPLLYNTPLVDNMTRHSSIRTTSPKYDDDNFDPKQDTADKGSDGKKEDKEKKEDEELVAYDVITQLFVFAKNANLIIASDAFDILNILLTKHKGPSKEYIERNFEMFFKFFNDLVKTDNYVTQSKFLKLLGDILLGKHNKEIRRKYVDDKANLIISMRLLRSPKLISFESFHIFKVFVANPNKSNAVHIILWKNRERLKEFLKDFQKKREETDKDFLLEKETLIKHLDELEEPPQLVHLKQQSRRRLELAELEKSKSLELEANTPGDTAQKSSEEKPQVPSQVPSQVEAQPTEDSAADAATEPPPYSAADAAGQENPET